ncbi:saccharopine dehydrogenase family protein [Mycolicibacterium stellerae]|uniref:saccharopine dehydrogenase family protein n=1 Tax=Mycolicibacterium stellerae TaxID=2358193 RepID=UPI000F0B4FDC|nr:saccharopine dehydrogenase NADP-binding domain-containing protein [Mycolicibacterium stellerae]
MNPKTTTVAVFGATGYTGRFVVTELLNRGITPIAIARDPVALQDADFGGAEVIRRHATVDDPASLDKALTGAGVVINCAGPFVDTAHPVVSAALRATCHYLDVCAEQATTTRTLNTFHKAARLAGVAVVPSMAFYGGLADLMATAAMAGHDTAESIDIMIGLDSWHPTRGTRTTIDRKALGNLAITDGQQQPVASPPARRTWDFGSPLHTHDVVELPFTETVLIARHVTTQELHNYVSAIAVREVLDPTTPPPNSDAPNGPSPQHFTIEVIVRRDDNERRAVMRGHDIYAISAPLLGEAAQRLLDGDFTQPGAHAPAEVFDADAILTALAQGHASFKVTSDT